MKISIVIAHCAILFIFTTKADSESQGTWRNVGECGKGLTCDPSCQLKCLEMHNYYRGLHGSPPLHCDPELAKSAQEATNDQASKGRMSHSPWTDKYTESISWKGQGFAGSDQLPSAIEGAVRSWYSEIKNDYNYESGEGSGVVGHFQTLVWKSTTKLGCGIHIKPNYDGGTYATAHYSPASHANADYEKLAQEEVKPRHETAPSCDVRSADRVLCDTDLVSPYVTPGECLSKDCCYDDMFLREPDVTYYSIEGAMWCFKAKSG